MTVQKGRDFILKIGDGGAPETFTALGAARTNRMTVNNNPVDATTMADAGVQTLMGDAGVQTMEISIEGLFKDSGAEETLRDVAFNGQSQNYELDFPGGGKITGSFVIRDYSRGGTYDGLETFSAVLNRNGPTLYTVDAS